MANSTLRSSDSSGGNPGQPPHLERWAGLQHVGPEPGAARTPRPLGAVPGSPPRRGECLAGFDVKLGSGRSVDPDVPPSGDPSLCHQHHGVWWDMEEGGAGLFLETTVKPKSESDFPEPNNPAWDPRASPGCPHPLYQSPATWPSGAVRPGGHLCGGSDRGDTGAGLGGGFGPAELSLVHLTGPCAGRSCSLPG